MKYFFFPDFTFIQNPFESYRIIRRECQEPEYSRRKKKEMKSAYGVGKIKLKFAWNSIFGKVCSIFGNRETIHVFNAKKKKMEEHKNLVSTPKIYHSKVLFVMLRVFLFYFHGRSPNKAVLVLKFRPLLGIKIYVKNLMVAEKCLVSVPGNEEITIFTNDKLTILYFFGIVSPLSMF